MDKNILGKRLRTERTKRNLTLEELSAMVGIGSVYLGEIERGKKLPSIKTFIKTANELQISTDYFFREEVHSGKPYLLNEMTELMIDLPPWQIKILGDVVRTIVEGIAFNEKKNLGNGQ